jgi:hypothetical protein
MANLPYVSSSNSLKTAFDKIRTAATPPRVTTDFVNTVLQIKGGTGGAITPFLKRVGFVASDGTPTELYKRFRNPVSGGPAMAEAILHGYALLAKANENFYRLSDQELFALIVQVTGVDANNAAAKMTLACLKVLKTFADFESTDSAPTAIDRPNGDEPIGQAISISPPQVSSGRVGLNLSYTINLNLPATADQAVFNAIFRSLKEHLLSANE